MGADALLLGDAEAPQVVQQVLTADAYAMDPHLRAPALPGPGASL